ncbi:MAG: terminase small subunit [Candidatus Scalindua sp.]|nr:terminase small subunit [Candidatus Scalindua sp.]
MGKLTAKQQRFIEEYCRNGFNATQAAKDAGYKEDNAYATGAENLRKPQIAKAIEEYKAKVSENALCDTEWVVKGLMQEAKGLAEDTTQSGRVAALKALSEFTGGFDSNKQKHEVVQVTHEDWLDSLK